MTPDPWGEFNYVPELPDLLTPTVEGENGGGGGGKVDIFSRKTIIKAGLLSSHSIDVKTEAQRAQGVPLSTADLSAPEPAGSYLLVLNLLQRARSPTWLKQQGSRCLLVVRIY